MTQPRSHPSTQPASDEPARVPLTQDISDELRYLLDQQRKNTDWAAPNPIVYARLTRRQDGKVLFPVSRAFVQHYHVECLTVFDATDWRDLVIVLPWGTYDAEPGFVPCRLLDLPEAQAWQCPLRHRSRRRRQDPW
jgi:hypothetical protein